VTYLNAKNSRLVLMNCDWPMATFPSGGNSRLFVGISGCFLRLHKSLKILIFFKEEKKKKKNRIWFSVRNQRLSRTFRSGS